MPRKQKIQADSKLFDMRFRFIETYNEGDVVFEEGSRGRQMFVVYSGRVRISKKDQVGYEIILATLGPGEILGEMALIDNEPRSATVTALDDDTKLINLDRARFMYLLRHEPEFALIVMEILCQRIREKNAQYSSLLGEPYGSGEEIE
jgi:CRP-like cAMP-binding protein